MTPRLAGIPNASLQREIMRKKGQFWTPDWIAEAMVAYVTAGGCDHIFDPAVGAGAFFRAAKKLTTWDDIPLRLLGCEIDSEALAQAEAFGLSRADLSQVQIRDFLLDPPSGQFNAIVANPPYIRHHRLQCDVKLVVRRLGTQLMGRELDGRAGLHVYFLLQALQLLAKGGRLAFIVPADTCEGVFAPALWSWITARYRLEAVVTFDPDASPFPGVDTNPVIIMIHNTEPTPDFLWVRCSNRSDALRNWVLAGFRQPGSEIHVQIRSIVEALTTGLSRFPTDPEMLFSSPTLGCFAKVLRGIATGANEYFFLTRARADELGIPADYLYPAIGRTRDVCGSEISNETLSELDRRGRPTLLLSLGDISRHLLPDAVERYLQYGEVIGIPGRPLVKTRRPWYKMEYRRVPPILFAYLGRRNARFIRNLAGVVPLTGFLCVYPHHDSEEFVERLWQVLKHERTVSNLALVGKSYGSGALKVEPRALEKLPLPTDVIRDAGLSNLLMPQLTLI